MNELLEIDSIIKLAIEKATGKALSVGSIEEIGTLSNVGVDSLQLFNFVEILEGFLQKNFAEQDLDRNNFDNIESLRLILMKYKRTSE